MAYQMLLINVPGAKVKVYRVADVEIVEMSRDAERTIGVREAGAQLGGVPETANRAAYPFPVGEPTLESLNCAWYRFSEDAVPWKHCPIPPSVSCVIVG